MQTLVYGVLLVLLAIVVAGVFVIRYEELGRFSPYQAILPSLAVLGLAAFALFLPVTPMLHVYIIGAAICTYFVLKHGVRHAYPTWNSIVSFITLYVALASVIGARFHFYIPTLILLAISFIITTLVAIQFLLRYRKSTAEGWLLALVVGTVLTQIIWALQFLPLHYLVQTGVILSVYYVVTQLISAKSEQTLTPKLLIEYVAFGGLAIMALLLTARWR